MQAFRAIFSILPLLLTAGALLLLILTALSGGTTSFPINKFYYLSAAVTESGVTSPDGMLHWTNYNVCGSQNDENVNCGATKAAYGFSPTTQLTGASPTVPSTLPSHTYITSRVYYAFLVMACFFTFLALLACFAGCFGRRGSAIGLLSTLIAATFTAIAAALMTVVYVRGRNYFRAGGIQSSVGVKLFAFMWAAVACLGLSLLMFAVGVCIPGEGRRSKKNRAVSYQEKPLVADSESFVPVQASEPVETTYIEPNVAEPATSVYTDLPRSSYERAPRGTTAPPIDGMHTTADRGFENTGTGATYLR